MYKRQEYTLTVPSSASSVTLTATPKSDMYQVTYQGETSGTVDLAGVDVIEVDVTAGDGADAVVNTYRIRINRVEQLDFGIDTTPALSLIHI